MPSIEIEYCVPCGFLDRAQDVQASILETYGKRIERVALVTGDQRVFTVTVDGDLVYDKADDQYDVDEIVARIGDLGPVREVREARRGYRPFRSDHRRCVPEARSHG